MIVHALGEHTGMKTELYQTNIKSQEFIYGVAFQYVLIYIYIQGRRSLEMRPKLKL